MTNQEFIYFLLFYAFSIVCAFVTYIVIYWDRIYCVKDMFAKLDGDDLFVILSPTNMFITVISISGLLGYIGCIITRFIIKQLYNYIGLPIYVVLSYLFTNNKIYATYRNFFVYLVNYRFKN